MQKIEGVTHEPWPDRDDGFSTLHYRGKEIAHFHHFNELDLKLGKQLIAEEGLKHYADSERHPNRKPGSQYIELRFQYKKDLPEVIRLVERAIARFA